MEDKLTIEQVLGMTIQLLGDIRIPGSMIEDIGIPISRAMGNLTECIKALQTPPEPEPEPEDPMKDEIIELNAELDDGGENGGAVSGT